VSTWLSIPPPAVARPGPRTRPGAAPLRALARRVLPRPAWVFLRERRDDAIFLLRGGLERCGLNVARRRDYYSPLPAVSVLARS
jgi:hypothetical protein